MQNLGMFILMYVLAYVVVTWIGIIHTIINIKVFHMKSMKESPGMGEGYEKTKPWHPLYNIIIFPIFGYLYLKGINDVTIIYALITGVIWSLISIIGDWMIMDVLAPMFMYLYRDDKKKRYIAVTLAYLPMMLMVLIHDGWHQLGVLMVPLIIIFCYNGKGGKKNAFNKWFFYIFYPAHLLILGIIQWVVLA